MSVLLLSVFLQCLTITACVCGIKYDKFPFPLCVFGICASGSLLLVMIVALGIKTHLNNS